METIWAVLNSFWDVLVQMSPYLLFGFFVAGILSMFLSASTVERHLGGRGIWPVIKASAFGVPLPLCSCSVIPVSASLRKHGASRGATTAFLISTPQTGVDSIFVTYSLLGMVFAIVRPIAALLTGILGGWLVDFSSGKGPDQVPEPCEDPCCAKHDHKRNRFLDGLRHGFITLPKHIARDMVIGLAVAALITALIPEDFFAEYLGTGFLSMVVMMLMGIPVYVCATASVPVAAAFMMKGITPGAAFVFLMTGPATNAATIAIIRSMMGNKSVLIYLATIAVSALAFGLLLDNVIIPDHVHVDHMAHAMMPYWTKLVSTAALAAVLGCALWSGRKPAKKKCCSSVNVAGPAP